MRARMERIVATSMKREDALGFTKLGGDLAVAELPAPESAPAGRPAPPRVAAAPRSWYLLRAAASASPVPPRDASAASCSARVRNEYSCGPSPSGTPPILFSVPVPPRDMFSVPPARPVRVPMPAPTPARWPPDAGSVWPRRAASTCAQAASQLYAYARYTLCTPAHNFARTRTRAPAPKRSNSPGRCSLHTAVFNTVLNIEQRVR